MSLAVEEQILESLAHSVSLIPGLGSEEGHPRSHVSMIRFMDDVRTVVNAVLLGAGLEGARFKAMVEEMGRSDADLPWAKVVLVFEGYVFYIHAKVFMDVEDIDVLADEAGEIAEKYNAEVVPLAAAYEYTYDAERYARSIEIETLRLGL